MGKAPFWIYSSSKVPNMFTVVDILCCHQYNSI